VPLYASPRCSHSVCLAPEVPSLLARARREHLPAQRSVSTSPGQHRRHSRYCCCCCCLGLSPPISPNFPQFPPISPQFPPISRWRVRARTHADGLDRRCQHPGALLPEAFLRDAPQRARNRVDPAGCAYHLGERTRVHRIILIVEFHRQRTCCCCWCCSGAVKALWTRNVRTLFTSIQI
jgi:hypothetical protein